METTRNAGSCCGHHGATSAPAHRTAAPAPQGYTPVDQLHNEIDRLFGDFFGGFFSPWRAFSGMAPRSADNAPDMLIPHMDLSVTDTAYKATVELPGVAQDQVNIEVRDNMLIVEGEKKNETEDKDEKKGYYRMERSYVPPRALPARGRRNRQDHRDPQGWRVEHRDSPQGTRKARRPQD